MWHEGTIGVPQEDKSFKIAHYWVKTCDEPSELFGIDGGRIIKLSIKMDGEWITNYDRGWDIKPETRDAEIPFEILMQEYN